MGKRTSHNFPSQRILHGVALCCTMLVFMQFCGTISAVQNTYEPIIQALEEGDIESADRLTTRSLAQNPDDAYLWFLRGSVDMKNKVYEQSERALQRALQLDPDMSKARYNLGLLFSLRFTPLFDPPRAAEILENLIERDPDYTPTYRLLGHIYRRLQKYDKAEKMLSEALRREPNNWKIHKELAEVYRLQRKFSRALEMVDKALTELSDSEELHEKRRKIVKSHVSFLLNNYKFDEALPIISGYLESEQPVDPTHLKFALAYIYAERGDVSKAQPLYRELMEGKRDTAIAKLNLARLYAMLNQKPAKAIQMVDQVDELVSLSDWRQNVIRAIAYIHLDKIDKAEEQLDIAARILHEGQVPEVLFEEHYRDLPDEYKYARALLVVNKNDVAAARQWLKYCNPPEKSLQKTLCDTLEKRIEEMQEK